MRALQVLVFLPLLLHCRLCSLPLTPDRSCWLVAASALSHRHSSVGRRKRRGLVDPPRRLWLFDHANIKARSVRHRPQPSPERLCSSCFFPQRTLTTTPKRTQPLGTHTHIHTMYCGRFCIRSHACAAGWPISDSGASHLNTVSHVEDLRHDLRQPLTSLTCWPEIARGPKDE